MTYFNDGCRCPVFGSVLIKIGDVNAFIGSMIWRRVCRISSCDGGFQSNIGSYFPLLLLLSLVLVGVAVVARYIADADTSVLTRTASNMASFESFLGGSCKMNHN